MEQQTAEETYESALLALRCRHLLGFSAQFEDSGGRADNNRPPKKELCLAMISV